MEHRCDIRVSARLVGVGEAKQQGTSGTDALPRAQKFGVGAMRMLAETTAVEVLRQLSPSAPAQPDYFRGEVQRP
jgi:hypothetical protein